MLNINQLQLHVIFKFFFLLLVTATTAQAQRAAAEIEKIRNAYLNAKQLSAQVEVVCYKSKDDVKGTLLGRGSFHKSGMLYHSRFNKEELLVSKQYTLVIDHEEKQVQCFNALIVSGYGRNQVTAVDSLLDSGDSIADVGIKNGLHQFIVYSKGMIEQTVIVVDARTNFVTRLISYYRNYQHNKQPTMNEEEQIAGMYKVVVSYTNSSTQPVDPAVFSTSKYITVKNNKPLLTTDFSGYQLIVNVENGL
jgi:outer membrane lipoprotein-sorting protein